MTFIPLAGAFLLLVAYRASVIDALVTAALRANPSRDYRVALRDAEYLTDAAALVTLAALLLSL